MAFDVEDEENGRESLKILLVFNKAMDGVKYFE
jgi:hypothetical protein